jgi:exopolyphosphatase/guanosine-5'-triphosphate,3'-diphosphate pyrophosphatase
VRVAAIDCGTNSVRLLVADADGGRLHDVHREMRIVRLGQDVDRTGRLAPEALERTRAALSDYAATIRDLDAERVRLVATSATRDATNRDEFTAIVQATVGVPATVVTGGEEAELSFTGAVGTLPPAEGPVLLTDVGGGSTELIRRDDHGLRAHSMDVGAVRMTERHLHDDPPTEAQVAAATADVLRALDQAATDVSLTEPARFVGVAGTITTIAALALGLDRYDSARVHGSQFDRGRIDEVAARLLAMTHDERAAEPVIHPGRVDVIHGGALVLRTVLHRVGAATLTVSEHDILDGIALGLAARGS